MKLSNNFSLEEFTKSATADRLGIDNAAPDIAVINLKVLCEEVLQPARDHFKNEFGDVFIKVNSGYRNIQLKDAFAFAKTITNPSDYGKRRSSAAPNTNYFNKADSIKYTKQSFLNPKTKNKIYEIYKDEFIALGYER